MSYAHVPYIDDTHGTPELACECSWNERDGWTWQEHLDRWRSQQPSAPAPAVGIRVPTRREVERDAQWERLKLGEEVVVRYVGTPIPALSTRAKRDGYRVSYRKVLVAKGRYADLFDWVIVAAPR